MSSAVEFVEGGVQDACEDACSICLDNFSDQDPAAVTQCNHEYHLQCILEWSQRSAECPMCWQPLILQDASSQELLASMEQERSLRQHRIRASLLPRFRSGDFYEFHQLPESFEEHILQHFTAVVGQTHGLGRGGHSQPRAHVSGHRPSQFFVFPSYSPAASSGGIDHDKSASPRSLSNLSGSNGQEEVGISYAQEPGVSTNTLNARVYGDVNTQSSSPRQRASESPNPSPSTSDFQSFSETFKARLAAVSSRYKESLTKTTRIFRERLRARNGVPLDTNANAEEVGPSIVENATSVSTAEQRDGADMPHSNLTAIQAEVADEIATDTNPVHTTHRNNNEEDASLTNEGSAFTSSQAVSDEAAGHRQGVLPQSSSDDVIEDLTEDKPTVPTT